MSYVIMIIFFLMNIMGLILMKVDKKRAIKHQYRISERTLWIVALLGGAIGTTIGMNTFRHKTKHVAFKLGFPLLAIIDAALYFYFLIWS